MKIKQAIRDYMMSHRVNNDSGDTLNNYKYVLRRFADWLLSHDVLDTDDLRLNHLREWVVYLQEKPIKHSDKKLKDTTVQMYAKQVLAFCHWLEQEEIIEKPITTRFKLPRVEKRFIPTLVPGDIDKLLVACEYGDDRQPQLKKALTARNRALVLLSIDAGPRRKELAGLRLCDIDRNLCLLSIHRKGNTWQQVPVSREAFKALHDYVKKHRSFLAGRSGITTVRKEDAVFLTHEGKPLTRVALGLLFSDLGKRAGIDGKRFYHHQCRRYMATTQLAMGRSPLDVQRQMGHTTLAMTNHYASLTVEHLRESHEKFSPLHAKDVLGDDDIGNNYWNEE
jgi:site-specific recombinase XerD